MGKPRKPRLFGKCGGRGDPVTGELAAWLAQGPEPRSRVWLSSDCGLDPAEARRLAAWLLQAADYLDGKGGGQ